MGGQRERESQAPPSSRLTADALRQTCRWRAGREQLKGCWGEGEGLSRVDMHGWDGGKGVRWLCMAVFF